MKRRGVGGTAPLAALLLASVACGSGAPGPGAGRCEQPPTWKWFALRPPAPTRSSTIVQVPGNNSLLVVNTEVDTVSVLDTHEGLRGEVLLAGERPRYDAAARRWTPRVAPRSVALSASGRWAYVSGSRSGRVYEIDGDSGAVTASVEVGVEPWGITASSVDGNIYVADFGGAAVVVLAAEPLRVLGRIPVEPGPRELALSDDGATLWVGHFHLGAVSMIDTTSRTVKRVTRLSARGAFATQGVAVADDAPGARFPQRVSGLAIHPRTQQLWVTYSLADLTRRQPDLDFRNTLHPGLTRLRLDDGSEDASGDLFHMRARVFGGYPRSMGSGPVAVAVVPDSSVVLVVESASDDVVMIKDSAEMVYAAVRPQAGDHFRGIALSDNGHTLYLDAALSGEVVSMSGVHPGAIDGPGLAPEVNRSSRLCEDPMPANLRRGAQVFHSANPVRYPTTRNFWLSCELCHADGRADGNTWQFAAGPRQTPSLAGGTRGTGRLLWTARRDSLRELHRTFNEEMGGAVDPADPEHAALLADLAAYIDEAIPPAPNPHRPSAASGRGAALFARPDVGCAGCHDGPRLTDSAGGRLHDVGTCNPLDLPHHADDGARRERCELDTPSLRGVFATAPFLHDGSAATLGAVLSEKNHDDRHGHTAQLTPQELDDLVAYLEVL